MPAQLRARLHRPPAFARPLPPCLSARQGSMTPRDGRALRAPPLIGRASPDASGSAGEHYVFTALHRCHAGATARASFLKYCHYYARRGRYYMPFMIRRSAACAPAARDGHWLSRRAAVHMSRFRRFSDYSTAMVDFGRIPRGAHATSISSLQAFSPGIHLSTWPARYSRHCTPKTDEEISRYSHSIVSQARISLFCLRYLRCAFDFTEEATQ